MKKSEVIAKIGKKNWNKFCDFMFGQTVGVYPDGHVNYYDHDVENFINKTKGKPTFFD